MDHKSPCREFSKFQKQLLARNSVLPNVLTAELKLAEEFIDSVYNDDKSAIKQC